jgi:hypothetical protein
MYKEDKKNFLEEVRALSESAKRRIVVVATIIIMIVVVYLWSAYFNPLIASTDSSATQTANQSTQVAEGGNVWQNAWTMIKDFGQYNVQPK